MSFQETGCVPPEKAPATGDPRILIKTVYPLARHKSKGMTPTVLTIGGSDPSGGAGIQADQKTLTMLGVYGAAAITCVTVQNSRGVSAIQPLEPDLVAAQIRAVLEDHHVRQVKIGMVGSAPIARAIGESLAGFEGEIIYDPVLRASTGQPLLEKTALETLIQDLIVRSTVLTPNLEELALLTGSPTGADIRSAAEQLLERSGRLRAVVVKGGHGHASRLTDTMFLKNRQTIQSVTVTHPRIETRNTHGTGCTFASGLAVYLCQGCDLQEAFHKTVAWLQRLLELSRSRDIIINPAGHGPMFHAGTTR